MNQSYAFTLQTVVHPGIWYVVDCENMKLQEQRNCFCCGSALQVSLVFRSQTSNKSIRQGSCPTCGYTTYIDRPDAAWLQDFYNTRWDRKEEKNVEDLHSSPWMGFIELVTSLSLPKTASMFEIGTGYGQTLKQLRDAGYTKLFGVEHAPERARLASEFSGAEVFHGVFGTPEVTEKIKGQAPFQLIYAKSVMEHVDDPRLLFSSAAQVQNEGDYLLIGVPDAFLEPTVSTLFFLPHLHAFTKRSLEHLAKNHGYVPQKIVTYGKGIWLVARKNTAQAATAPWLDTTGTENAVKIQEKWIRDLKLDELSASPSVRMYWGSVIDPSHVGILPRSPNRILSGLLQVYAGFLKVFPDSARRFIHTSLMRVLFHIPRRHFAFLYRLAPHNPTVPITIYMKELQLFHK